MKKSIVPVLFLTLGFAVFQSCSKDEMTPDYGKPNTISCNNDILSISYNGNNLSSINNSSGFVTEYNYDNNGFKGASSHPTDKNIADGNSDYYITREGSNKIIVNSTGDPSFTLYKTEIEVNETGIPSKITYLGGFQHMPPSGELQQVEAGSQFSVNMIFDNISGNIIKLTMVNKNTLELVATYDYEYDNNPGIFSKTEFPLWFYALQIFNQKDSPNVPSRMFLCHTNNIIKETITNPSGHSVVEYNYNYNSLGYPVSMSNTSGFICSSINY